MALHNGMYFTTIDNDNDNLANNNCAKRYNGGWWYEACHNANPNGQYGNNLYGQGIIWQLWHDDYYSLPFIEMKIK